MSAQLFDLAMRASFTAVAPVSRASSGGGARSFDVVASTETVDRCGRVVMQDWDLASYLRNPILLWNHGEGAGFGDSSDTELTLPIGHASNVRVEANELRATLNFVDAKASPLAEKVYQGMRQCSIRAVSVGWIAHEVRVEIHDDVEVIICAGNELLEISPVAIPANANAGVAASVAIDAARHALAASMPCQVRPGSGPGAALDSPPRDTRTPGAGPLLSAQRPKRASKRAASLSSRLEPLSPKPACALCGPLAGRLNESPAPKGSLGSSSETAKPPGPYTRRSLDDSNKGNGTCKVPPNKSPRKRSPKNPTP